MHPEMEMLRCAIVRGGTSKGVYIMMNEYPKDPAKRDAVVLAIYGSPDVRQIDGLGGADVLTSKHAIISPSTRPDADVDYTFGQVSIDTAFVDYRANCGAGPTAPLNRTSRRGACEASVSALSRNPAHQPGRTHRSREGDAFALACSRTSCLAEAERFALCE
jgi:hypothetical protein